MALKVLMMGGRRCGKTSALASLFDQMINGATNDYLTVADDTNPNQRNDDGTEKKERIETLNNKKIELKHFIGKATNNTFLVDAGPTKEYWDYLLRVQIPGTNKSTHLRFRDANGEFYESGNKHHDDTMRFVQDCDVFIVVVDTPYLMAGKDFENEAANVVGPLHDFLTAIDTSKTKGKQVIFVPIKCEKWMQEGKADEVVAKVEATYSSTIKHLVATEKTEISIIPIQTAGDILFSDLRDPYILYNTVTKQTTKCSKLTGNLVVLNSGENHKISEIECLQEDPKGVFAGKGMDDIVRPTEWFHHPQGRAPQYAPYNCEQLPLHIIRFMFNKMKAEAPGGIWGRIASVIFGTMTKEDLQNALDKLSKNNLIKDNTEGIKTIKKIY